MNDTAPISPEIIQAVKDIAVNSKGLVANHEKRTLVGELDFTPNHGEVDLAISVLKDNYYNAFETSTVPEKIIINGGPKDANFDEFIDGLKANGVTIRSIGTAKGGRDIE